EKPVRTKVFDFLYKLATSDDVSSIGKRAALARSSGVQMMRGNRSFTVSRGTGLKFNVVDLRGRSAMSGKVSAGESVDLSSLKNGVYVLRVQGEHAIRFGLSQ
ncbi:MAG: T9SS type A sorting domain-containing protein, partial [Fibrobacter sp.]|nr:T9SS type A sorting domain-containing protein [Fibrobacter sp.]